MDRLHGQAVTAYSAGLDASRMKPLATEVMALDAAFMPILHADAAARQTP